MVSVGANLVFAPSSFIRADTITISRCCRLDYPMNFCNNIKLRYISPSSSSIIASISARSCSSEASLISAAM